MAAAKTININADTLYVNTLSSVDAGTSGTVNIKTTSGNRVELGSGLVSLILDPATGKVYSVKIRPIEGGSKLEVRGFMGFSLLGRTQVWVRR